VFCLDQCRGWLRLAVNGKNRKGIKQTWEFPEQGHQQLHLVPLGSSFPKWCPVWTTSYVRMWHEACSKVLVMARLRRVQFCAAVCFGISMSVCTNLGASDHTNHNIIGFSHKYYIHTYISNQSNHISVFQSVPFHLFLTNSLRWMGGRVPGFSCVRTMSFAVAKANLLFAILPDPSHFHWCVRMQTKMKTYLFRVVLMSSMLIKNRCIGDYAKLSISYNLPVRKTKWLCVLELWTMLIAKHYILVWAISKDFISWKGSHYFQA